ncbi:MAG: response regulator [Bacteroidetes bacterium]|nr:response regulator [Bacteroidota bacterium]
MDEKAHINWSEKRILVVEDDLFSAEYLVEVLSDTKVDVVLTKDGSDAVQKVKNEKFDLVLMDIQLPGISGDKATQLIREFNQSIPIIAQTAHAMSNDREKYLKAGCNDYLAKPILITDLLMILKKYL